ncbi:MAG: hypothetical protein ACI97N_001453, partial [Cognaticolwellia sp.]
FCSVIPISKLSFRKLGNSYKTLYSIDDLILVSIKRKKL